MYAVCVTFQLDSGTMSKFMPLMVENAKTSQRVEPDCHQFDVATDTDRPDHVFLYELYTDRAAFDLHLASAHFKSFDTAVAPMIAGKTVTTWDTVAS